MEVFMSEILKKFVAALFAGVLSLNAAVTIYVDNVKGNDRNPGTQDKPVMSISRGLALLRGKTSGKMEVINTGKVYREGYPGVNGRAFSVRVSGTENDPVVINGNGAVFSGLAKIPAAKWTCDSANIYSLPFWPMSNMMKSYKKENYWHDGTQIWFLDGKPAKNCHDAAELQQNPGGFWWDKANKVVRFHLPAGKTMEQVEIMLPSNEGFYVHGDHVIIKNFFITHSRNDGFDSDSIPRKNVRYINCVSIDNCGQGMSCHGGETFYENCVAIRCSSTGICNVGNNRAFYKNCLIIDNCFESGVAVVGTGTHTFENCIISGNTPFEQIVQSGKCQAIFKNCLIETSPQDTNPVAKVGNGILTLQNCTVRGGKKLVTVSHSGTGVMELFNCIVSGQSKYTYRLNGKAVERCRIGENVYVASPGFLLADKKANKGNYAKIAAFDKGSVFVDTESDPAVAKTGAGAKIPAEMVEMYNKFKKCRATVDGVVFDK